MTPELRRDLIEWARERPDDVRSLMRRFPPACKVRALRPLSIPAPDEVGVVVSYGERGSDTPDGWLGVISPDGWNPGLRAQCTPEQLEVVAYDKVTPEDMGDVLAELERHA